MNYYKNIIFLNLNPNRSQTSSNPAIIDAIFPDLNSQPLKKFLLKYKALGIYHKFFFVFTSIILLFIFTPTILFLFQWILTNEYNKSFFSFALNPSTYTLRNILISLLGDTTIIAIVWKTLNYILTFKIRDPLTQSYLDLLEKDNHKLLLNHLNKKCQKRSPLFITIDSSEKLDNYSLGFLISLIKCANIFEINYSIILLLTIECKTEKEIILKYKNIESNIILDYKTIKLKNHQISSICKNLGIDEAIIKKYTTLKDLIFIESRDYLCKLKDDWQNLLAESDFSNDMLNEQRLIALLLFSGSEEIMKSFNERELRGIIKNKIYQEFILEFGNNYLLIDNQIKPLINSLKSEPYNNFIINISNRLVFPLELRSIIKNSFPLDEILTIHLFWLKYYEDQYNSCGLKSNSYLDIISYQLSEIVNTVLTGSSKIIRLENSNKIIIYVINKFIDIIKLLYEQTIFKGIYLYFDILLKFIFTFKTEQLKNVEISKEFNSLLSILWEFFLISGDPILYSKLRTLIINKFKYEIDADLSNKIFIFDIYVDFLSAKSYSALIKKLENTHKYKVNIFTEYIKTFSIIRYEYGFIDEINNDILLKVQEEKVINEINKSEYSIIAMEYILIVLELFIRLSQYQKIINILNVINKLIHKIENISTIIKLPFFGYYQARFYHLILDLNKKINISSLTSTDETKVFNDELSKEIISFGVIKDINLNQSNNNQFEMIYDFINKNYNEAKLLFQLFGFDFRLIDLHYFSGKFYMDYSYSKFNEQKDWWKKWYEDEFISVITLENKFNINYRGLDVRKDAFNKLLDVSNITFLKNEIIQLCDSLKKYNCPNVIYMKYFYKKKIVFRNYCSDISDYQEAISTEHEWLHLLHKSELKMEFISLYYDSITLEIIYTQLFLSRNYLEIGNLDKCAEHASDALLLLNRYKRDNDLNDITEKNASYYFFYLDLELFERLIEIYLLIKQSGYINVEQEIRTKIINLYESKIFRQCSRYCELLNLIFKFNSLTLIPYKEIVELCYCNREQYRFIPGSFTMLVKNIFESYDNSDNIKVFTNDRIEIHFILVELFDCCKKNTFAMSSPKDILELHELYIEKIDSKNNNIKLEMDKWLNIILEGEFRNMVLLFYEEKKYYELFKNYLSLFNRYIEKSNLNEEIQKAVDLYNEGLLEKCLLILGNLLDKEYINNKNYPHDLINNQYLVALEYYYYCAEELNELSLKEIAINKLNEFCESEIPKLLKILLKSDLISDLNKEIIKKYMFFHDK